MMETTKVVVENSNNGMAGLLLIILFSYLIYTCISLYACYNKRKKLRKAVKLIEEGHQRKINVEGWKNNEKD